MPATAAPTGPRARRLVADAPVGARIGAVLGLLAVAVGMVAGLGIARLGGLESRRSTASAATPSSRRPTW